MKLSLRAALALAIGGASLPPHLSAAAVGHQASDQSSTDAVDPLIMTFFKQFDEGHYAAALATADGPGFPNDSRERRAIVQSLRGTALLGLKRDKDAHKAFDDARQLGPDLPVVDQLQFEAGLLTDNIPVAASAIDRLIARFPDTARNIASESVWYFLRNEPAGQETRNENRRVLLAELGFGGDDGDELTADAVKILLKRGDTAGASDLLKYIDNPSTVEGMLIQTRFAPLWPTLERLAGPQLETIRNSSVKTAERAVSQDPGNRKLVQSLANALRHAGRLDEAIALGSSLPQTAAAMGDADEDTGWLVNNVALALHQAGRGDEADALFARLSDANISDGGWRVSMHINRLELLVADGKFDAALALMDFTEASARDHGNGYSQQLVRRLRYCTLSGLGRKDEAAKLLPAMLGHAKDAYHATIDGLLCAGDIDRAEQIALTALDDAQFQEQFIRSLQLVPLTDDDPSIWQGKWKILRSRPAIETAFARIGRDMPAAMRMPPTKLPATTAD
jgi:tetratricopeptide (TPR) repeat protein